MHIMHLGRQVHIPCTACTPSFLHPGTGALWPPSLYGSAAASPRAAADFRSKCESYTCAVLRDLDGLRTKCVLEASSGATSATAGTVGSRPLAIANAPLDVSVDPSHHAPWRGRPLPHIVHFMHKFKPWNPSMRALRRVHRASILRVHVGLVGCTCPGRFERQGYLHKDIFHSLSRVNAAVSGALTPH